MPTVALRGVKLSERPGQRLAFRVKQGNLPGIVSGLKPSRNIGTNCVCLETYSSVVVDDKGSIGQIKLYEDESPVLTLAYKRKTAM